VATDFSSSAIEGLRRWLVGRDDFGHVELLQRSAASLDELTSESFDTVILNSVVQYFPDIEYLLSVLKESARVLRSGGNIFIGDVRHLGLLPMFHSAVQLSKAAATVNVGQLRRRVARAVAHEKELLINPQFFQTLTEHVPQITGAHVRLKRGRAPNEMTRYRYDVVLQVGKRPRTEPLYEILEWQSLGSLAALRAALTGRKWCTLHLRSIPNSRLAKDGRAQTLIATSDERLAAGTIRRQLSNEHLNEVDPEELWECGNACNYDVQLCWCANSVACFDAELLDRSRTNDIARSVPQLPELAKPPSTYANDPAENSLGQQLIPRLREYLKQRLPEYMMPSGWMTLKHIPLTPNGKLDLHTLPVLQTRPEDMGEYTAPRTELERKVADIWTQLLRVDEVGVHDSFFELGGHSLLATRVISHINDTLHVDLPLRVIFDEPTIEAICKYVEEEMTAERG
jgi:acyl carrier protein